MNRVSVFLRSVVPEDPAQLIFLFGVVCLFVAPNLRWNPGVVIRTSAKPLLDPRIFAGLALFAILFAATAGYFVCFRPGSHPVRRLLWWVCVPALTGILGFVTFYIVGASLSVIPDLGPGFHYALVGLVLVAVFTSRVALGLASLPLALPQSSVLTPEESASWQRVQNFLWVLLALLPVISWIFPVMKILYYVIYTHVPGFKKITGSSELFVTDAVIILIAVLMIGREARDALRRSLRWPAAGCLALAVAFPVGIAALISVGQFLFDLLRWAAHRSDGLRPSHIGSYFNFPSVGLLSLLFVAFSEEIIFRGLLQPRFIRRYGLFRGIFLLGIVFAAAHLSADFSTNFTDALVILKLCVRLAGALPLCFVAGWLTLRSESVLPAAVAHGLLNILGFSPFGPTFAGIGPLIDLLWAALAYALFRYWPVQIQTAKPI